MSITQALSNSLSGLSASGRMAETVSNNVANALTPVLRGEASDAEKDSSTRLLLDYLRS